MVIQINSLRNVGPPDHRLQSKYRIQIRGQKRLPQPAAHLKKELSKLPREAVCSAVSSRVRGNCSEKFAS